MHQGGGEGVAGADGVGDLNLQARMFVATSTGVEDAAALAAGDADEFQVVRGQQPVRGFVDGFGG